MFTVTAAGGGRRLFDHPPGTLDEKISATGKAAAPRKTLATNVILQEKLSWYMETMMKRLSVTTMKAYLTLVLLPI